MRLVRFAGLATLVGIMLAGPAFAIDREHLKPVGKAIASGERFTLTLQSDPGDWLGRGKTYRYTDADVVELFVNVYQRGSTAPIGTNVLTAPDYIDIDFFIGKGLKSDDDWDLTIGTNQLGKAFATGTYLNAMRASFAEAKTPGLDFTLNGHGCNTVKGRYTISAIAFDCMNDSLGKPATHLKQLVMNFEDHCEGGVPAIRGQLSYVDNTGFPCDTGTGSGGGGGGGGGTPTPTPTPSSNPLTVVLSDDTRTTPIVMTNSSSSTVLFSTFAASDSTTGVSLSAASDSNDLIATINKPFLKAPGIGDFILTIQTTPTASAGDHVITITATDGIVTSSASVFVTVLCDPPFILGIDQPKNVTVNRGRAAVLSVKASGSGPFSYQWFTGSSGLVNFPLAGGTTANFATSALNDTTSYWVRVTNPCGSVDSQTVTASVAQGAKPGNSRR